MKPTYAELFSDLPTGEHERAMTPYARFLSVRDKTIREGRMADLKTQLLSMGYNKVAEAYDADDMEAMDAWMVEQCRDGLDVAARIAVEGTYPMLPAPNRFIHTD